MLIISQCRDNGRPSLTEDVTSSDNGDVLGGSRYWSLNVIAPTKEIHTFVMWYVDYRSQLSILICFMFLSVAEARLLNTLFSLGHSF